MAIIPSSAIKFYTASSGGTQVTSGSSGETTIYPRLIFPFTIDSNSITAPYYGRENLSGTKTYTAGGDEDTFTLNMAGGPRIQDLVSTYQEFGGDTIYDFPAPVESGGDYFFEYGSMQVAWDYGYIELSFELNFASYRISVSDEYGHTDNANTYFEVEGVAKSFDTLYTPTGDPGQYGSYTVFMRYAFDTDGYNDGVFATITIYDGVSVSKFIMIDLTWV